MLIGQEVSLVVHSFFQVTLKTVSNINDFIFQMTRLSNKHIPLVNLSDQSELSPVKIPNSLDIFEMTGCYCRLDLNCVPD